MSSYLNGTSHETILRNSAPGVTPNELGNISSDSRRAPHGLGVVRDDERPTQVQNSTTCPPLPDPAVFIDSLANTLTLSLRYRSELHAYAQVILCSMTVLPSTHDYSISF